MIALMVVCAVIFMLGAVLLAAMAALDEVDYVHEMAPRTCPSCDSDDTLTDDDGVALCLECCCSFEMVR